MTEEPKKRRFLTTEQAAEELNVSSNQVRALLKTGELRAIQTEERITSGDIVDDAEPEADYAQ